MVSLQCGREKLVPRNKQHDEIRRVLELVPVGLAGQFPDPAFDIADMPHQFLFPQFIVLCFNCTDVPGLETHCEEAGIDFLCKLQAMDTDKPELAGTFIYIKDPDGIPLEFVHIPMGT